MRPHRLELTAIGSYAGEVTIDFDGLAPFGLFHIHGPTGAGKSSLLDGLCFALYGKVPPPRMADQLRSHHAQPRVEAKAVLDFSLQDVDYRIVRTPTQWRAKKVGTGLTEQRATAAIHRRTTAGLEPIESGVREVDGFIEELLGLDHAQFMQVVVLPQGGFQEALRASAKDRGELLSTLFHAERFGRYGEALKAKAGVLSQEMHSQSAHVEQQLQRLRVRTVEAGLPVDWPSEIRFDHTEIDALKQATDAAKKELHRLQHELDTADQSRTATGAALSEALRTHDRQVRRQKAQAQLHDIGQRQEELSRYSSQLTAAREVQPLLPAIEAFNRLETRLSYLEDQRFRRSEVITSNLDRLGTIAPMLRDLSAEEGLRVLAEADQRRSCLSRVATEAERREEHNDRIAVELENAEARLVALESAIHDDTRRLDALATRAAEVERLTTELARLCVVGDAATEVIRIRASLFDVTTAERVACETAQALSRQHLGLWERRLTGFAAELAAQLKDGEPCAVCGSKQHPAPLESSGDEVTEAAVEKAKETAEGANEKVEGLKRQATVLRSQLETQLVLAGDAADEPQKHHDAVAATRASLQESQSAAAEWAKTAKRLERDQVVMKDLRGEVEQLRRLKTENSALLDQLLGEIKEHTAVLGVLLGPSADVDSACDMAPAIQQACEEDNRLAIEIETTLAHVTDARRRLFVDLAAVGCTEISDVTERALEPSTFERLTAKLTEANQLEATARAVIEETADIADTPASQVEALREAAAAASAQYDRIVRDKSGADLLAAECIAGLASVTKAFNELRPLREETDRVRLLAEMCFSGKNEKRMSLKNFVLAAYLEEVAAAASARLKVMSSGRYQLHHSDKLVKGGAGSGLSLIVSDAYTGQEREVSSLSGGETFMASLALALGLADVVQSHAGGVHIEALFIDEGFGSLDADTLELAMAELDRLREGGRLVGVISHVPTLRERIPAGIEVLAGANGSTIRMRNVNPSAA